MYVKQDVRETGLSGKTMNDRDSNEIQNNRGREEGRKEEGEHETKVKRAWLTQQRKRGRKEEREHENKGNACVCLTISFVGRHRTPHP